MRLPFKGAIAGLTVGAFILLFLFLATLSCLPFRISYPPAGFPLYCQDIFYQTLGYLAFPINLLTNDLARAVYFSPLSLLFYALIGFWVGSLREARK